MLKVLFVTSEIYPLIKTGGLADVSGSLPPAIRNLGADIRILVPGYAQVLSKLKNRRVCATLPPAFGLGEVKILKSLMPDTEVPVYILDYPDFYAREGGPYQNGHGADWEDNALRFGLLSSIAAFMASGHSPLKWKPQILHCNDWQSGLAPAYLKFMPEASAKSVMTVHNIAFQGNFSPDYVHRLGLPQSSFDMHGVEFHGHLSFLKAGLYYSDKITTVSPTYAQEIQTAEMGCAMEGLLSSRKPDVQGILNGIDRQEWDPSSDPHLPCHYDGGSLEKKSEVKKALQSKLGLDVNLDAPLLGVVSRLTYQKGIDLILDAIPGLLDSGGQIAVLGSGDHEFERRLLNLAESHAGRAAITIGFNEPLSHQIMAGADIFLMPSRFEPCGLNQMYGMRYGTPPLVRGTGGLADSVSDSKTGFVFAEPSAAALKDCIHRAVACFRDKENFAAIQKKGMQQNFGWEESAKAYLKLYETLAA